MNDEQKDKFTNQKEFYEEIANSNSVGENDWIGDRIQDIVGPIINNVVNTVGGLQAQIDNINHNITQLPEQILESINNLIIQVGTINTAVSQLPNEVLGSIDSLSQPINNIVSQLPNIHERLTDVTSMFKTPDWFADMKERINKILEQIPEIEKWIKANIDNIPDDANKVKSDLKSHLDKTKSYIKQLQNQFSVQGNLEVINDMLPISHYVLPTFEIAEELVSQVYNFFDNAPDVLFKLVGILLDKIPFENIANKLDPLFNDILSIKVVNNENGFDINIQNQNNSMDRNKYLQVLKVCCDGVITATNYICSMFPITLSCGLGISMCAEGDLATSFFNVTELLASFVIVPAFLFSIYLDLIIKLEV